MAQQLTVGVIGLGVGAYHVEAFLSHPFVKDCRVSDFDQVKVAEICRKYPGRVVPAASAGEIVNDPSVGIVSVASYDNYHAVQVLSAIAAGKHVFVEKPMCLSPGEAQAIGVALTGSGKVRLSSNMVLRTCPRFAALKVALARGEFGAVYAVNADYLWGRGEKLTSGWRKDMAGYSIILGAAVHMIDLVCWILGRFPVKVQAAGNQIATAGSGFAGHDFAVMLLTFDDGLVVQLSAHGGCAHPHYHRLEVWGTRRTFSQHLDAAYILEGDDAAFGCRKATGEYPAKSLRGQVALSFVDHVIDVANAPLVPREDVFRSMSVCFAAEEAMKTGRPVTVKYIQ